MQPSIFPAATAAVADHISWCLNVEQLVHFTVTGDASATAAKLSLPPHVFGLDKSSCMMINFVVTVSSSVSDDVNDNVPINLAKSL